MPCGYEYLTIFLCIPEATVPFWEYVPSVWLGDCKLGEKMDGGDENDALFRQAVEEHAQYLGMDLETDQAYFQ